MTASSLRRYAAFTATPEGGNPAGVWVGEQHPEVATMQHIATEVGFSETAFVAPRRGPDRQLRYFSPRAEVSFCGHATIAAAVALGQDEGAGLYRFSTSIGPVPVQVQQDHGRWTAALTSVPPTHEAASPQLLDAALATLGWARQELDPSIPPARAYAGAWHLVLAAGSRQRLARMDYDFEALESLMHREDLTTLQLIWREAADLYHSRNPFPVGGVVEDPATGAAAAALGGYLRETGLLAAPAELLVRQGEDMGRPSRLEVLVPAQGGIVVRGEAVAMAELDGDAGLGEIDR